MDKNENAGKLSLFSLVCIAAGNVIGVGIITTTGLAIAQTGRSVWISYGLAVLIGFLWLLPGCFFASIAKFKGAPTRRLPPAWAREPAVSTPCGGCLCSS